MHNKDNDPSRKKNPYVCLLEWLFWKDSIHMKFETKYDMNISESNFSIIETSVSDSKLRQNFDIFPGL